MKRILTIVSVAIMVGMIVLSTANQPLMSSSGGAPEAKTGSPSDGNTCLQCHGANPGTPNGAESIALTGLPTEGYTPNATYDLTITASGSSNDMFGFEISPQDWDGNMMGTWIMGATSQINNIKWLTHTFAGTAGSSGGTSWDFQWVAPSTGAGVVNFYYTVLFADGMNAFEGDVMLQDSVALNENTSVGIDAMDEQEMVISNLIGRKAVVVQTADFTGNIPVSVTDMNGREVYSATVSNGRGIIDLSTATNGIYVVTVTGSNRSIRKKVLLMD